MKKKCIDRSGHYIKKKLYLFFYFYFFLRNAYIELMQFKCNYTQTHTNINIILS